MSRGSKTKPRKGVCQFCGCTEHRACVLAYGTSAFFIARSDGDLRDVAVTCSWWNEEETVCNKASCVEAFEAWQEDIARKLLIKYRAQQKRTA